ncbi:MAG TPA: ATP-binding protein [Candidatus Thermoplasmatota archaeon]|nr:ATP-binding protein [Candidatus Thermoplasmatota archaeon]
MAPGDDKGVRHALLDQILDAIAQASVGELGARVEVPADAGEDDPLATLGHALNVLLSDLQARERTLRDTNAFRRSLLEGLAEAGVGFIVSDGRRVLHVNEAFARMMASTPEQLEGLDTTQLVVPEERDEGRARQEERVTRRVPQAFRCTFLRADGSTFPAEVTGKPLRGGDPPRFLALVRDLTDEERSRAELEAARRQVAQSEKLSALGSLVSGVAHEVRTPLTYLQNSLYLLQRRLERAVARPGADEDLRALLPDIETTVEAAQRIERLVDDLRRYTRLRAGEPQPVALDVAVRQGVELFRATHSGGVEVRAQLEPTPRVDLDALSVQQIVLNLLSNAADASVPGSAVHVRTRATAEGAELEVADEGSGIPPETLARAFDPFFTTKSHGTGLGLSIVRRIVEESGGTIFVASAPGKGTTFRIEFPAREPAPPSGGARELHEGI